MGCSNCYFCRMLFFRRDTIKGFLCLLLLSSVGACEYFKKSDTTGVPVARVGDAYLYKADIAPYITDDMTAQDSATFVVGYINNWASKQLLLSKSKINLPEDKLKEFDRLVTDYRPDLYTRAYVEALVQQDADTAVSASQLGRFYEAQKENFKLSEKVVQLRFVVLPNSFLDKETVVQKMRAFEESDKQYLDSIAVQFNKIHLNDSIWVSAARVLNEIPALSYENEERYLKKSQFFELQDSLGVYLGKVTDVLEVNDVAPLSYITPDIKQIILNRRRQDKIRQLETEIIDEATKNNEFEIYGKEN